jgi:hypothetical protein
LPFIGISPFIRLITIHTPTHRTRTIYHERPAPANPPCSLIPNIQ